MPPLDIESRILFINDDIIAVNKLAGEAMEGAEREEADLPRLLAGHFGKPRAPGKTEFPPTAVHRLDIPVSGCALFARNRGALVFLDRVFAKKAGESGRAEKYYWAIVEKSAPFRKKDGPAERPALAESGELLHWIVTSAKANKSRAFDAEPPVPGGGKPAKQGLLRYRLREGGERYLFLEIELVTGRHHQIRAQLAAVGLSVKGDLKYGAKRSEKGGGIRLHARSLCFPDPSAPENRIRVTALPPLQDRLWKDFAAGL